MYLFLVNIFRIYGAATKKNRDWDGEEIIIALDSSSSQETGLIHICSNLEFKQLV